MSKPHTEPDTSSARPRLTRRDFIKIGATTAALGVTAAAVKNLSSPVPGQASSAIAAEQLSEEKLLTTCAFCPSGCGLEVRVAGGKAVKIEGNPVHPLNQGVCCLKGQTALEALYSPERLAHPRRQMGERGSGDWQEISWDEALSLAAEKLGELRAAGQAHSVAFLHGETRGQMRGLIERFMRAYGSPNVIGDDSLGQNTIRLASLLSQGINGLPAYDFNNANYVMTFGGNLLESSRNLIGALASIAFMRRGRPQRGKLVAVHPRLGITGIKADEWVPIRPGTYGALALGMANVIINSQLYDQDFVRDFTFGFEDFVDSEGNLHMGFKHMVEAYYGLEQVAAITGVPSETIARLAGEFATNRPAVAVLPTEPGEMAAGNSLYSALAVHALNALAGSIDCPGGVLVQRFPEMAGWPEFDLDAAAENGLAQERLDGAGTAAYPLAVSAYQEVAGRILVDDPYPVNALFLYNTNPVHRMPNGEQFVQALMKVPFVVSFAPTLDESAAHADLILPASTFLEVWGDDFMEGSGYAGVSLRRPVVEPVHDTRNPAEVLMDLAGRIGGPVAQALPWGSAPVMLKDRLAGIDMDWEKFETNTFWSEMVYFNADPGSTAWSQVVGRDRLHTPRDGRYDLFSRELLALYGPGDDLACLPHFEVPAVLEQPDTEFPFFLVNQGLITDNTEWQGILPTLQESYGLQTYGKWDSWLEINPATAEELGLEQGDPVWVESPAGRIKTRIRLYPGLWPNAVFMPPGMGHRTLVRWGRRSPESMEVGKNANALRSSGTEAPSGQAVFSPTRVRIIRA